MGYPSSLENTPPFSENQHMVHPCSEVIATVRHAVDVQQVRTHIDNMARFLLMDVGLPVVNAAVKQIHVAQEVVDERRRWVVIDFVGGDNLFDSALGHHHHS